MLGIKKEESVSWSEHEWREKIKSRVVELSRRTELDFKV